MSKNDDFKFEGFEKPKQNWTKLPHTFFNLWGVMTLAEERVVLYILRHTWGFSEFDKPKKITLDEFVNGRKRKDGSRMDGGTELSQKSVKNGLAKAVEHGFIIVEVDDRDKARIKKSYQIVQGGKNYPSEGEKLPIGGVESTPRTEKDTLERNSGKKKDSPPPKNTATGTALKSSDPAYYNAIRNRIAELCPMSPDHHVEEAARKLVAQSVPLCGVYDLHQFAIISDNNSAIGMAFEIPEWKLELTGQGIDPTTMEEFTPTSNSDPAAIVEPVPPPFYAVGETVHIYERDVVGKVTDRQRDTDNWWVYFVVDSDGHVFVEPAYELEPVPSENACSNCDGSPDIPCHAKTVDCAYHADHDAAELPAFITPPVTAPEPKFKDGQHVMTDDGQGVITLNNDDFPLWVLGEWWYTMASDWGTQPTQEFPESELSAFAAPAEVAKAKKKRKPRKSDPAFEAACQCLFNVEYADASDRQKSYTRGVMKEVKHHSILKDAPPTTEEWQSFRARYGAASPGLSFPTAPLKVVNWMANLRDTGSTAPPSQLIGAPEDADRDAALAATRKAIECQK